MVAMNHPERKTSFHIKVYARQRPFTNTEIEQKSSDIVHSIHPRELIVRMGFNEKKYTFDHVFGGEASQQEVYNTVVSPMISNVIAGYNCTVLAYGQTGTGKTHTIFGETKGTGFDFEIDTSVGMIPRASHQLFSELSKLSLKTEYTVRVSFIEIYNEEVRDLLNESIHLRVYDDPLSKGSVCMKDLSKITVLNTQDVYNWLTIGLNERQNAATNSNLQSSRSHTLFTFLVNIREVTSKGEEIIKTGRFYLVDLAGSENTGRSGAVDVRAREAGTINRSLISVSKVIKALAQKLQHIPYRDSKLTRILQDSLGGNTKTAMIVTFSPSGNSWDETNVSLELAHTAKTIINNPQINVNKKQANLLQELKDEVTKLKEELSAARAGEGFYISAENYERMTQEDETNNKKILELIRKIREMEDHSRSQEHQYRKLTQSFERTKEYLSVKEQDLSALREALREEEHTLQEMNLEHVGLSESANALLNICETSTKNEGIYHEKYQDKCAANTNNARVTQEMVESSLNCLNDIRRESQDSSCQNAIAVEELKRSNAFLQKDHLLDLEQMKELGENIRARGEYFRLQMEELVKNCKADKENFQTFVGKMDTYQQKQADVSDAINKLKQDLKTKIAEAKAMSEQVFSSVSQMLQDNTAQVKADYNYTTNFMLDVKTALSKKEEQLREQLQRDEAMAAMIRNEQSRIEREEQALRDEAAALPKLIQKVTSLINEHKSRRIQMQNAKASVNDYMQRTSQVLPTQKSVIENVIHSINQNQNNVANCGPEVQSMTKQYLDGITGTVQRNLTQKDTECRRVLNGWNASGILLGNGIEQARNVAIGAQNNFDQVQRTLQRQHENINRSVDMYVHALEDYNQRINPLGHVGDTPVRRSYNYPRKITGGLRREVLEAQMLATENQKLKDDSNKEN